MALSREVGELGFDSLAIRLAERPLIRDLPASPQRGSTLYLEDPRRLFSGGEITKKQKSHLPSSKTIINYEREHGVRVVYNGPYKPDNYYRYLNHDTPIPTIVPQESWEERSAKLSSLPTPDTAGPGYSGPYKPNNYYDQSYHEKTVAMEDNVIFDSRLSG